MARTTRQITVPLWLATLLLSALAELLSFLTWFAPELGPVCFGLFAGAALVTALRDPRAGFLLLTAEAVIGGHGHLFTFGRISIRMIIFGATMLGWVVSLIRSREPRRLGETPLLAPLAAVTLAVGWGFMRGLVAGRDVSEVINDANGYAMLIAIPMALDLFRQREAWQRLCAVFSGAVIWLSVKSLAMLYLFTHDFGPALGGVYLWQRTFWLSELTPMGGWMRVFSASDVFLVLAVFAGICLLWKTRERKWWAVVLPMAALLLSFSRSLWLGALVGVVAVATHVWQAKLLGTAVLVKLFAFVVLVTVVLLPLPTRFSFGSARSADRLRATDAAVSSRWNMLPPLERAIASHPILGNGFGATITYQSDDPRIHALYKNGIITTSAIEWQYLELWLKMGLMGLVSIGWLFVVITRQLVTAIKTKNDGIFPVVALASFVAFVVLNVFTPYINHTLGWMFLALMLVASQPHPDSR